MSNMRQEIVKKVLARMRLIRTENDYVTEIGASVHEHRTEALQEHELPALIVRDGTDEITYREKQSGAHHHSLPFTIDVVCQETDVNAEVARKALADVMKAIGVDPRWGGVAKQSLPKSASVITDKEGNWLGGARVEFTVEYQTAAWAI
ncbi:MAG: hypothetical protein QOG00_266 [Pyrinomonadaceae bacterium]|nr:hypothetical protein [Pyrinomonadaceae bacterium]